MTAVGSFTATSEAQTIVPAHLFKHSVTVQWYDGGAINVAVGTTAEAGKGIRLSADLPATTLTVRAQVSVVREDSEDGLGGWATL